MSEQRWLSLTGICSILSTTSDHIWWLVKNGYLEMIPGKGNESKSGARFLDPTPEYLNKLRTTELIYGRRFPMPADFDLDSKCIFSRSEVGVLMGWTSRYTHQFFARHKEIPCVKTCTSKTGGLCLYSAKEIRKMIWKKQGKSTTYQSAPFLIPGLIELFRSRFTNEDGPTDAEFAEDAVLQKKLQRLLKLPREQREAAVKEFMAKVQLAKEVAGLLKKS